MRPLHFTLLLCFVAITVSAAAFAAELPKEPLFRIESGRHTDMITGIAADTAGRWLVTASKDKTVRVWELPDGRLARTIRPPIGNEAEEGDLVSVTISPEGNTIAAGGFTLHSDKAFSIYLFDRASGSMVHRITGLPGLVYELAYTPDGRYLAASMAAGCGLRLYRTSDWTLVGEDRDYGGTIESCDISKDGRLVTSSNDRFLRLYDVTGGVLRLTAKVKAPGPKPDAVRFSPDGTKVAVGYEDLANLSVHSGRDLSFLFSPEAEGRWSDWANVAWSSDGRYLFAAGARSNEVSENRTKTLKWLFSYTPLDKEKWTCPIRRWSDGGKGSYIDIEVTDDGSTAIQRLASLADGQVAYFTSDHEFGVVDQAGKRSLLVRPGIATHDLDAFKVSRDGGIVTFAFEKGGRSLATFDLATRTLAEGPTKAAVKAADTYSLDVTDWRGQFKPRFSSGYPIPLRKGEVSRALAIVPYKKAEFWSWTFSEKTFILGTDWFLRRLDHRSEKQIWELMAPSSVVALNVAGDGSVFLAAYGDGTIRWHRVSDGKELVAFFPSADRKRWVMWTPEGYFDASPGGAELIGYHINQGKDKEAKFLPVSYLYDVFYRPDIVQAKIKGEDISSLITLTAEEALKTPPPEVNFTSIPSATPDTKAKVCYQVKSTGGGIGEVRLFQNGKLIKSDGFYREAVKKKEGDKVQLAGLDSRSIYQDQRGLVVKEKKTATAAVTKSKGELVSECVEVETMPGENELSLAAFNSPNTVQSFMDTASFVSSRPPEEPHLYILSVGIDSYRDASINLKYAAKDATDFVATISEKASSIYKPENIHLVKLTNDKAGKNDIMKAYAELASKIKHCDGFIFFNASHGVLLQNQYYIVTADFNGDLESIGTLISSNEIVEMSKGIKSLSQLFIFDTCHAGGVDNIVSGLYDARMVNLARKMGLHIYASAGSVQTALDGYQGNGLYTHTLLQGITKGRDVDTKKSGMVTVKSLGLYTKEKTTEISTNLGHPQSPVIINYGRDNPLFSIR